MENIQINKGNSFRNLLKWMIICLGVTMALVLVVVILSFIAVTNPFSPGVINGVTVALLIFAIIELVADVGLMVLTSISLAYVSKNSNVNAQTYRITFGILLGLFVLFWIIGIFFHIVGIFQLITAIVMLVFACIYYNKLIK